VLWGLRALAFVGVAFEAAPVGEVVGFVEGILVVGLVVDESALIVGAIWEYVNTESLGLAL